ncbi:MAG TPA: NAD-dependent protein deacetylase [Gemmatimonadaceae bacterium]|nr:NAD-dependent protein deacetylase [Gemmatimonadaceae bacterium]
MSDREVELERLAELVRGGNVAVLTGAGISTESGIPDYRGPEGKQRVTPMMYQEFVGSVANRQRYWARSFVGWRRFAAAAPNAGHYAVAKMQLAGLLGAVITQNVDGLHQRAGAHDVLELHGSLARVVCLNCGNRSGRAELEERLRVANPDFVATPHEIRPDGDVVLAEEEVRRFQLVRCLVCGSDLLKPDVIFFGESVPKALVERCFAEVERSDALLVLGSSLQVMSGYRFVLRAAELGIPVAIVTRGITRGDDQATIRIDAPLGETLRRLEELTVDPRASRSARTPG